MWYFLVGKIEEQLPESTDRRPTDFLENCSSNLPFCPYVPDITITFGIYTRVFKIELFKSSVIYDGFVFGFRFWLKSITVYRFWVIFRAVFRFSIDLNAPLDNWK